MGTVDPEGRSRDYGLSRQIHSPGSPHPWTGVSAAPSHQVLGKPILRMHGRGQPWWVAGPYKNQAEGLPWWRSGWESACQCRGHEFETRSGRIPHAAERLGP